MANPVVTFEMENGDIMKAELYPEVAPNTVNNFVSLVKKGYYDGLIFHRVINGFMIQGGCPDGTGMGGPGYSIKGEFAQNGFANELAHTEGVLSMARAMHPDSAGSQFFIMHANAPHLDGQYASALPMELERLFEGAERAMTDSRINVKLGERTNAMRELHQLGIDGTPYTSPMNPGGSAGSTSPRGPDPEP